MTEPDISNSSHRWLLPFWADPKRQYFFDHLAPELQADALAAALEADYPAKAQEIREWNGATRRAMLAVLDMALTARHTAREVELWRLRKGERELRCVAVYLQVGIDLRRSRMGRCGAPSCSETRTRCRHGRERGVRPVFRPDGSKLSSYRTWLNAFRTVRSSVVSVERLSTNEAPIRNDSSASSASS